MVANTTASSLEVIGSELTTIHTTVLQNCLALDYILAKKGGACKLVGSSCCVYIPDGKLSLFHNIVNIQWAVRDYKDGPPSSFGDFNGSGIFGVLSNIFSGLGGKILCVLLSVLVLLFLLYLIFCIIKKCICSAAPKSSPVPLMTFNSHISASSLICLLVLLPCQVDPAPHPQGSLPHMPPLSDPFCSQQLL